jgi:hypothetical protein
MHFSIASQSAPDNELVNSSPLSDLPTELKLKIMINMSDILSLLSLIETCSDFQNIFIGFSTMVLSKIFINAYPISASGNRARALEPDFDPSFRQICRQLDVVIRRKIIPREDAVAMYDIVWERSPNERLLLLQPGRALIKTFEASQMPKVEHLNHNITILELWIASQALRPTEICSGVFTVEVDRLSAKVDMISIHAYRAKARKPILRYYLLTRS